MRHAGPYRVTVAPQALSQMQAALAWWAEHRRAAGDLLAREIDAALSLVQHAPQAGRRVTSRKFRGVRRLLLRRTRYLIDYQVVESAGQVRIVHFRHGRRRPR